MSGRHNQLPGVLAEIEEIAGREAALDIARAVGGNRVYFARKLSDDNWLVRTVGRQTATLISQALTSARTGCEIEVPLGPISAYQQQLLRTREVILTLMGQGKTTIDIARSLGTSRRNVQKLIVRMKRDGTLKLRHATDDTAGPVGME